MKKSETIKPNARLNLEVMNYFSGSLENNETPRKSNGIFKAKSFDPWEGIKEKTLGFDNYAHITEG